MASGVCSELKKKLVYIGSETCRPFSRMDSQCIVCCCDVCNGFFPTHIEFSDGALGSGESLHGL